MNKLKATIVILLLPIIVFSQTREEIIRKRKEANKHGKIVLLRRGKKQANLVFVYSINDTLSGTLSPNSCAEYKIRFSNKPIKLCYGVDCNEEMRVLITKYTKEKYIECSLSKNKKKPKFTIMDERNGKFYAEQLKYLQRRKKGNVQ